MKAALVTGGSRGLGAEVALALGRAGYSVCVNFRTDEAAACEVAEKAGEGSFAFGADVSDYALVMAMIEHVRDRFGRLDVLVSNAGITHDSLLLKLKEEDWQRVMDVNLKGCFNAMRAVAPLMAEGGGGHVVIVSSRSGLLGWAGQAAYSASKAALLGFTRSSAGELAEAGIRVNALLPGYMPTDMGSGAREAMAKSQGDSLLGMLSSPGEAASFVLWLVGTSSVTGQVFVLDSRLR